MFIRSTSFFFSFLALHRKGEEVWLDGTHPMLFEESSCVCMRSFRPVAPFLFLAKVPFFIFFDFF